MAPRARYTKKDGTPVPRCTTVINVLGYNKEALLAWTRREALKGVDPNELKKKAADLGTLTHKMIEAHIKNVNLRDEDPKIFDRYSFDQVTMATAGYEQYLAWEAENAPEYLESEYKIVSENKDWGGTADCIANIGGVTTLIDFKTSKSIYADHVIQVSAYKDGINEIGQYNIQNVVIIHIPKEVDNGVLPPVKPVPISESQLADGLICFDCALALYARRNSFTI